MIHPISRSLAAIAFSIASVAAALSPAADATGPGVHGRVFEVSESGRILGMIAGAKVEFLDEAGGVAASAESNASGYYQTDLPLGRYYFRVSADGFRTEDSGRGLMISRSDDYMTQHFSLVKGDSDDGAPPPRVLQAVGMLNGAVVTEDPDGNQIPVAGARVTLRRMGEVKPLTVFARQAPGEESESGEFLIQLPTGTWIAAVEAPGFERLLDSTPIEITSGETFERTFVLTRAEPTLPANQGVRGEIVIAPTAEGEIPSGPVRLLIRGLKTAGSYPRSVTFPAAGSFTQDLPEGVYQLAAVMNGHPPAFSHPLLVAKATYTNVRLVIKPASPSDALEPPLVVDGSSEPMPAESPPPDTQALSLSVTILEASAAEPHPTVADAMVLVRPEKMPSVRQTTDAQGETSYDLGRVSTPIWATIVAQKDGYGVDGTRTLLQPGESNEVTILLRKREQTGPTPPPDAPLVDSTPEPDEPPLTAREVQFTSYLVYRNGDRVVGVPGGFVTFRPVPRDVGVPPEDPTYRMRQMDLNGDGKLSIAESEAAFLAEKGWRVPTGELGRFTVTVPVGTYHVTPSAPQGFEGEVQTIEVMPTGTASYVYVTRITPAEPSASAVTIRVGRLESSRERNGELRSWIRPISGATVSVTEKSGARTPGRVTDREGKVSVTLAGGFYRIEATKDGFAPGVTTIEVDSSTKEVSVLLEPAESEPAGGGDHGLYLAVHEAGNPLRHLPNAKIAVIGVQREYSATLQARRGSYYADVPPGTYRVEVAHAGYELQSLTVRTDAERPTRMVVGLRKLTSPTPNVPDSPVQIRALVDYGGEFGTGVLSGATVSIFQGGKAVEDGKTDGAGIFRTSLTAGMPYQVRVSADPNRRLVPETRDFVLRESYSTDIVLRSANRSGPGRTTDGAPPVTNAPVEIRALVEYGGDIGRAVLSGATVSIYQGGTAVAQGTTDRTGVFRTSLAVGTSYQVRVSADPNRRLAAESRDFVLRESYKTDIVLRSANSSAPGQTPRGAPGSSIPGRTPRGAPGSSVPGQTPRGAPGSSTPGQTPRGAPGSSTVTKARVEIRALVEYGGEFGTDELSGATVTITQNGRQVAQGVTDRNGVYRADLPTNATYVLRVSANANQRLTAATKTFSLTRSYSTSVTLRRSNQ